MQLTVSQSGQKIINKNVKSHITMQPQTPQQANMGLGARGSNPQHLNQITLHTTSGIVRMIQPQNHQLFAPIQVPNKDLKR